MELLDKINKLIEKYNLCPGNMVFRNQIKKDIKRWDRYEPYSLFYVGDRIASRGMSWAEHIALLKVDLLLINASDQEIKELNCLYAKNIKLWSQENCIKKEWLRLFNNRDERK